MSIVDITFQYRVKAIVKGRRTMVLKEYSLKSKCRFYSAFANVKGFKKGWVSYRIIKDLKSKKFILRFGDISFVAKELGYGNNWADVVFKEWTTWAIEKGVIQRFEQVLND